MFMYTVLGVLPFFCTKWFIKNLTIFLSEKNSDYIIHAKVKDS